MKIVILVCAVATAMVLPAAFMAGCTPAKWPVVHPEKACGGPGDCKAGQYCNFPGPGTHAVCMWGSDPVDEPPALPDTWR